MRTSACASVGVVTKLVNMHAPLRRWIVALDVVADGGRRRFGRLLEGDGPRDVGVSSENCDCRKNDVSQSFMVGPTLTILRSFRCM